MTPGNDYTERVLSAARAATHSDGFAAAITDIADRAGVGVASIYRRWKNRDAIVRHIAETMVADGLARLDELDHIEGAPTRLRKLIALGFELFDQYGQLAVNASTGALPVAFQNVMDPIPLEKRTRQILEDGVREGAFRADLDVEFTARAVRSMMAPRPLGDLLRAYGHERIANQVADLFLENVSAR